MTSGKPFLYAVLGLVAAIALALYAFNRTGSDVPSRPVADVGGEAASLHSRAGGTAALQSSAGAPTSSDGPLPVLSVDPEIFVRSSDNPYRCVRVSSGLCAAWLDDPWVARSPAEARWMAQEGFPDAASREWAASRSSASIRAEAARTNSPALAVLALLKAAEEVSNPEDARQLGDEALRWAGERSRLLGIPGVFGKLARARILARAHALAEEALSDSGRPYATAAYESAFSALRAGDTLALEHLRPLIAGGPDEYMTFTNAISAVRVDLDETRAIAHMREKGIAVALPEVRVRPAPIRREVFSGDGSTRVVWYGEP